MGRQWLQAKREVAGLKKCQAVGKLVKEIMVAAKLGGPDPDGNARLFAAIEKARRQSTSRDVIERAIKKGAGIGGEKLVMEHVVFEGYAPHKVPVIVEVMTDNNNRTAPDMRLLFNVASSVRPAAQVPLDHVGLVEAIIPTRAPISKLPRSKLARMKWSRSAKANSTPCGRRRGRFITDRAATAAV